MPRARTLFAMLAAILLATATYAGTAVAAVPPGAPGSCAATLITGTPDDYRITWTRPLSDGGAPIWRYAIKVKGQSSPVVTLSSANIQTENLVRAYDWTGAIKGTSPLTFQVHRAFVGLTESPRLMALADSLSAEVRLGLAKVDRIRRNSYDQVTSHRALLNLLERGDVDTAVAELQHHLEHAETSMLDALHLPHSD